MLLAAAACRDLPKAAKGRHLAAADALLLWAHTRTFATATEYEEVRWKKKMGENRGREKW